MTATTFEAIRQDAHDLDLVFRPNGSVILHDTTANPVHRDWAGPNGAVNAPTTTFGAGLITEDGVTMEKETENYEMRSMGYKNATYVTETSSSRTLSFTYQETPKREVLEEILGSSIPTTLDANSAVRYAMDSGGQRNGLRVYVFTWMDTPEGVWVKGHILHKAIPQEGSIEIKADGTETLTPTTWNVVADDNTGLAYEVIEFGPGFAARAARLGYTTA